MFKFFRNIRKDLLSQGKTTQYLKYAIGEIILVVLGILIALGINSINETKKRTALKNNYIQSLIADLKSDTLELGLRIRNAQRDLSNLNQIKTRLSHPEATLDTVVKIARYDFNPVFSLNNELNQSTYKALVSTGNIDLLSRDINQALLAFNAKQNSMLKAVDANFDLYLDELKKYRSRYILKSNFSGIGPALQDTLWKNVDKLQLLRDFNALLSGKIASLSISTLVREALYKDTKKLLSQIKKNNHN